MYYIGVCTEQCFILF